MPSRNSMPPPAAWWSALFLVVLGAKLWVIQAYGTGVPYWDQWDEARLFFIPWLEGHLTWGAWFAPHNEHRILFTRALDLLGLWLNRQWDPLLQMVINAFLHAGYACGLAVCLWIFTGRKHAALICLLLVPFFALPFAAENTIHGFHSQEYFLSIFAVVTIIGLGFGSPGGGGWFCGLAAAVMSLFTMGSGILAPLAVTGLVVLRALRQRRINRGQCVTLGCSLAVFVSGLLLDVALKKHGPSPAGRFWTFGEALLGNLAWPFLNQPALLLILCLPLAITLVKYFRSDFKDLRSAEFVLTLGFWGFLQAAALAYARAHLGSSSRYMDTLCTLSIASLGGLFILGGNMEYRRLSRPLMGLLAMAWVACLFWGMWQTSWAAMGGGRAENYMQYSRRLGLIEEHNVRAFVATDDPACLLDKPLGEIPYPEAGPLIELLRNPSLMAIMPPACRVPLRLEKDEKSGASFVLDGCPPGQPKPEFTRIWGCYPTHGANPAAAFVSQPLSASLPKLIIPVGCGTNLEGIRLQLVALPSGRRWELSPHPTAGWQTIIVTAPPNPFRLEITGQNPNSWVAVGDFNEMGRLSCYARLLLDRATGVFWAGVCLFVLLAGFAVIRRRPAG